MPESRAEAEKRADENNIPKSNVYCLETDTRCYIAPNGITSDAAKKAYAEARDKGDSQEVAAKIAWTVQKSADEARTISEGTMEIRSFQEQKPDTRVQEATDTQPKEFHIRFMPVVTNRKTEITEEYPRGSGKYRTYFEIITPEFLQRQDFSRVRVLREHDPKQYLTRGNTNAKFELSDLGLYVDVRCNNTQLHRDTFEETRSGEFCAGSFGFYSPDKIDPKTNTRTVINGFISEVSLVRDNPAYEETAAIAMERKTGEEKHSPSERQGNDPADEYINKRLKELLG